MNVAPELAPEEGADEDVEEEEQPAAISFFGDDDAAVCKRVWDVYMRDSIDRGFEEDTKSRGVLAPHLAAIEPGTKQEEKMVEQQKTKRGALLERVSTVHRELVAKHGREPTHAEVFAAIGPAVAKSVANISMALRRAKKNGLLNGKALAAKAAPPEPKAARRPRTRTLEDLAHGLATKKTNGKANGHTNGHAKTTAPPGVESLVAGLIAQRDFHADTVAALTIAIEALGGGGGQHESQERFVMLNAIDEMETSTLRAMESWLDKLPFFVMGELRKAIKNELLARELPALADESGGYSVPALGGVH